MIEYLNIVGNFMGTFWWVFLLIAGLRMGAKWNHEQKAKIAKQYKRYGTPPNTECPKNSRGHKWNVGGWSSGIHYHRALGRDGHRCFNCGEMAWKVTDEEFVASEPAWILQSPGCKIPEHFLQYIPKEVLDKRAENIHNKRIVGLQRRKQAAIDTEKACTEELEELQ